MDLTHKSLCDIAVRWLKRPNSTNGHGCQFAVSEVASGWNGEMPDAIGFKTEYGYLGSIVVEVKVSRADFLSDKKKPHRNGEVNALGNWRYYMCPEDIIKPEDLPEKFGLLYINKRGHVKHIVSPFTVKNWNEQRDILDGMRFEANVDREMFLLTKLLARLGDSEKYNSMLKEANNRANHLARQLEKMRKQQSDRQWRALANNPKG